MRITGFSGVVPRRGARLLEPNQAQVAVNCRLTSGYIGALNEPKLVEAPAVAAIQSVFRMPNGASEFWLAWPADVDAVKGPIAGDTTYRTYYTGDNEPRVTDLSLASVSAPYPGSCYVLGVYPPATAPGASHAGGAGAAVSRSFVYTFVTQWGEESQPSPASSVTVGKVDGTWTVNTMDTAPANSFAVTGGSWATGSATLNMASTFGLRVGETVNVEGVTPSGYNVTGAKLTAVGAGSISFALASNPGAWTAGGTVSRDAPHNTSNMVKRIYWTETDSAGTTSYRYVKEVPAATTSTTVAGNTVSAESLPSADWAQPPTDMINLVALENGMMAGSRGNELCFCEPYKPYAWPAQYRQPTTYEIVALGVFLTSVVVCTKGTPYICTGTSPEAMIPARIDQPWPCLAKRGVANLGFGVAYTTPAGLALIGTGGSSLVTKDLYTQEEWTLLNPSTFIAASYAGRYVATFSASANSRQIMVLDKSEYASVIYVNSSADEIYADPENGKLYVVVDDVIKEWDADTDNRMMADWMSREWVLPRPVNLGAAKVDADFNMTAAEIDAARAASDALAAANAALIAALATEGSINAYSVNGLSLNGSRVQALPAVTWDSLTFQLYVDGVLKYSKTLSDDKAFRLPDGYKSDAVAIRLSGNITIKAVSVARSMLELRAD